MRANTSAPVDDLSEGLAWVGVARQCLGVITPQAKWAGTALHLVQQAAGKAVATGNCHRRAGPGSRSALQRPRLAGQKPANVRRSMLMARPRAGTAPPGPRASASAPARSQLQPTTAPRRPRRSRAAPPCAGQGRRRDWTGRARRHQ